MNYFSKTRKLSLNNDEKKTEPMTTTNGLIILGNTGAGKSFIGNLILNREAFVHECNADSVTHKTEFCEFSEGPIQFSIFNIPGLIENEQAAVERNKVEIHKAFGIRPKSIVAFVFNAGAGGRITEDDIIAFHAIKKVYSFESKSFLAIVNDLPPNRPPNYDTDAKAKLEKSLGLQNIEVCCLHRINQQEAAGRSELRQKLLASIKKCITKLHHKQGDIILRVDELEKLRKEWKVKQDEFEREINLLKQQIWIRPEYESPTYLVPVPVIYSSPPSPPYQDVLVPRGHPHFERFCDDFCRKLWGPQYK